MTRTTTGARAAVLALALLAVAVPVNADLFEFLSNELSGEEDESENEATSGKLIDRFEPPGADVYRTLAEKRALSLSIARSESAGLVPSPALNAYVNDVLKKLVTKAPVPGVPARAFVRASTAFGASAAPDGAIFVNLGLLHELESEDELAAVLAHELAHVLYRHHGTDWFVNSQKLAASAASLGDRFKGLASRSSGEDSDATLLLSFGAEISERVIAPNLWTKEQEEEADRLGLDIMVAAGYSSRAPLKALKRLAVWERQLREQSRAGLKDLGEELSTDVEEEASEGDLSGLLNKVFEGGKRAAGAASDQVMDELGGDHYSPEERIDRLKDYLRAEYRTVRSGGETELPWRTNGAHPTTVVMNNYRSALEAWQALSAEETEKALGLARAATSAPTETDPYPRLVFSHVRLEQGNANKSFQNLELATRSAEPAFVIYRMMIARKLAAGQKNEAVQLLEEASRRLDNPPHLMPYRIAVLSDAGKKVEAAAQMSQCKLSYPELGPFCERALEGTHSIARDDEQAEPEQSATGNLIDRESDKVLNFLNR